MAWHDPQKASKLKLSVDDSLLLQCKVRGLSVENLEEAFRRGEHQEAWEGRGYCKGPVGFDRMIVMEYIVTAAEESYAVVWFHDVENYEPPWLR